MTLTLLKELDTWSFLSIHTVSQWLSNTLTLQVVADVWGEQPAARIDGGHAGAGGSATDQTHGWHPMPSLLQDLPVYVHREQLRLRTHAHQVQAHRGVGTHTQAWREKKDTEFVIPLLYFYG